MASPNPQNTVSNLQTYKLFWYTDNSMANIDVVELYPATDDVVYDVGCVIAQIISGPNAGKWVNYNPDGVLPGQDTITPGKSAIICDEYLTSAITTDGGPANICWGNTLLYASSIYWTEPGADDPADVIGTGANKIPGIIYGTNDTVIKLF